MRGSGLKKGRAGLAPLRPHVPPVSDTSTLRVQGTGVRAPVLPPVADRPVSQAHLPMPSVAGRVDPAVTAATREQAATTIQSAVRGWSTRKDVAAFKQRKAQEAVQQNSAATTIQTNVRGFLARKQAAQKKKDLSKELTALGGGRMYVGMATVNAEHVMAHGFEHRESNDPLTVDKDARNGKGIYLSDSKKTAGSFAAQNSPRGIGRVIQFDNLDLRGLSAIRHNADTGKHDIFNAETGASASMNPPNRGMSTDNPDSRLLARKTIVAKKFGGDAGKVDYVTGKTQNMGTQETVLFSARAVAALNKSRKS